MKINFLVLYKTSLQSAPITAAFPCWPMIYDTVMDILHSPPPLPPPLGHELLFENDLLPSRSDRRRQFLCSPRRLPARVQHSVVRLPRCVRPCPSLSLSLLLLLFPLCLFLRLLWRLARLRLLDVVRRVAVLFFPQRAPGLLAHAVFAQLFLGGAFFLFALVGGGGGRVGGRVGTGDVAA